MKSISKVFPIVAVGALAGALALPSAAQAQGAPRTGTLELILPIIYTPSSSFNGQGGSSADINSNLGAGFALGYNVNNHFQVGGIFSWSSRGYTANIMDVTPGTIRKATGTLETSTIGLYGTYFFMPSGFTPFVTGGIGSTFVDTNIPNGAPASGCYYDPWYGQICGTYTPTKTQTALSYTAGAGVRFELNRTIAVQGSYNKMWIDLSNGSPSLDVWRLDFVFRM
jgi:opacity protein-like surface antigen